MSKIIVPKKAVVVAKPVEAVVAPVAAVAAVKPIGIARPVRPVAAKPVVAAYVDTFVCENDGVIYPWTFKDQSLGRNFANQVWRVTEDGQMGEWCGVFRPETGCLDDSAAEPIFDECE